MVAIVGFSLTLAGASILFCEFSLRVPRRPLRDHPAFPGSTWTTESAHARDGVHLDAWFARPAKATGRCVIVLHGIADSRSGSAGFAPMYLAAGYAVLMPDSRAHGTSGGELVTYGLQEKYDVIEWAAWLGRRGCADIYGLGESLGASVLIQASNTSSEFRGVIAECPYSSLREIAEYRLSRQNPLPDWAAKLLSKAVVSGGLVYARLRYGLDLGAVDLVKGMRRNETPIMLIHGLQDFETPYWHSQVLAKSAPHTSLWLVPGAGHVGASATEPQAFWRHVLGWLGTQPTPDGGGTAAKGIPYAVSAPPGQLGAK
jgi:alpha-beta hydrolase superfamily lysophospholipase